MNQQYIGILKTDLTIINYIKDYIKPSTLNYLGVIKQVPIIYNGSLKWVQVRRRTYIVDENGNTLYPLISFSRTNTSIKLLPTINKAWAMQHRNFILITNKYQRKYQYNDILNKQLVPLYYRINIPIEINCDYLFQIYTDTNWQMNHIILSFMIHNRMWWIVDGYRVFVKFSGFSNTRLILTTTLRLMKSDFSLLTKSMIYPKEYDIKILKKPQKNIKISN